jgi:hypothetical protein
MNLEIGDKIVFCRGKRNNNLEDVTVGRIYTIDGDDGNGLFFIDDASDKNWACSQYGTALGKATKIIK